jgi:hypothetical protein
MFCCGWLCSKSRSGVSINFAPVVPPVIYELFDDGVLDAEPLTWKTVTARLHRGNLAPPVDHVFRRRYGATPSDIRAAARKDTMRPTGRLVSAERTFGLYGTVSSIFPNLDRSGHVVGWEGVIAAGTVT